MCFGAKSTVCYFGVARPKEPQRKRSSKILSNGKYYRNGSQTHSGKKNAGGVVNQADTLSPSWHPHEDRQSKSKRIDRNPGWIGGDAFTPVKNPFAKEGDPRVGEDKKDIKIGVYSENGAQILILKK